ncbi:CsbD family protein [Egibacter rhizosphaerae]|uniref:CsbD family protein n=1 Tax=Egibacter rhizosphaerae TaxID=1670831 RepID=A0A411YJK7_9ACTN|nr:CsbD family protein [Egibacter rhizosphaerae]QBI21306.1 CsbD family protein [Egibacter rhizosphaerae]
MADEKGRTDKVKGKAKEAAGEVTDDEELRREGKTDQAAGTAKEKVDKAADKVKETFKGDENDE